MLSTYAKEDDCLYEPAQAEQALAAFTRAYPAYVATAQIDDLRATDYARLDRLHHVYLDYTGGGLYAESQLRQHMALLADNVFGNPHSNNPTSLAMTHLVERARAYVLEFFNASPAEYAVVFTANASGALKLVGESYPFGPGDHYLLTYDNHNSVNGIREFARARGAQVTYLPVSMPESAPRCGPARSSSEPDIAGPQPPLCVSGPVELQRRAAPAGMGGPGAAEGLGCVVGLRGVCAHQST